MVGKMCRLCFEKKSRPIGIFSVRGVKLKMAEIIRKHLPDEVNENDDVLPKFVCANCWIKAADFHTFYNSVIDGTQIYFAKSIKYEEPIFNEINSDNFVVASADIRSVKLEPKIEFDERLEHVSSNGPLEYDEYNVVSIGRICTQFNSDSEPILKESSDGEKEKKEIIKIAKRSPIDENPENVTNYDHFDLTKQIAEFPSSDLTCEFCETNFQSFGEAKRHYQTQHKNTHGYIKCCKRRLKTRAHIIEHIKWHLNPNTFKCTKCQKIFDSQTNLRRHSILHEPEENRKFKCRKCNKKFLRKHLLTSHINIVHSQIGKPFECDICHSKFKVYNSLKSHILHTHVRKFEQICERCGKVCISKAFLEKHMRTHDEAGDPVKCKYCSATLKNPHYLKSHITRIHESAPATCPHCSKTSPNRNALTAHIRKVHNFTVHKCHLCTKVCKSALSLTEHMATHTGEYLYDCVYCAKEFKSHSNMYQHLRESHPIEWSAVRKTKPQQMRRNEINLPPKICCE